MKHFLIAMAAIVLSFTTVAAVDSKYQPLADMILSGDIKQLKIASQRIYENRVSDPALLDIAAEVLLKKYPDVYASEVDTLAWLSRAIGASENGRYYSVLAEVVSKTQFDKLERHAEKALDMLPGKEGEQYVAGIYQLPEGIYEKEAVSTLVVRLKSLMLAGDLKSLKQGAREMVSTRSKDQVLSDIAAEILLTHYAKAEKHQIDTFAWLANAIGSTGSARYIETLREIEENSDFRKLRGYAEKNREKLAEETVEQYKRGMFDEPLPDYLY
ncbi:hypothetical protein [Aestuariibacter sp. A3R04]|uniref:hypothetical protein n=1 Tax=Aestuariibacter sp. A3R04 TaxID=2841571 RepID=UPI001C0971BD|nr:hypothetical protein [Aestuariibacter sp. A3R04]MBU3020490.1 hypothetical protein [Aestuariibacter sp. A3R04]